MQNIGKFFIGPITNHQVAYSVEDMEGSVCFCWPPCDKFASSR